MKRRDEDMAKLTKTSAPGVFRRHQKGCGGGRCDCAYVVVWRHRGKQHKETFRTLAEAREGQARRGAGDGPPASKVTVDAYFTESGSRPMRAEPRRGFRIARARSTVARSRSG
jgi:hypothetical protein